MDINNRYKIALHWFTKSGTHESQFYGFCDQKKEVLCLRKLLNHKPGLNETVQAGLPPDSEIRSDKPLPSTATAAVKKEEAPSSGKKAKRHYMDTISDGFKVMQQMEDTPEMKQAKFDSLVCDQQQKDHEDERQAHQAQINKYKEIQEMICDLRTQMKHHGLDEDDNTDLQEDVNRLKKKKNELALKLGFTL